MINRTSNSHVLHQQPNHNLNRSTAGRLNLGRVNNVLSAELEVFIEKEKITSVLNQTLYKIQLAICLPIFLSNDCELLRSVLDDKELSLISNCHLTRFSAVKQRKPKANSELQNNVKEARNKSGDVTALPVNLCDITPNKLALDLHCSKGREDPEMCRIINILSSKPRSRLRSIIKTTSKHISSGSMSFFKNFCELRNLLCAHLNVSPFVLSCRDRELCYAWRRNENAKLDICKLMNKLELQKTNGYSLLDTRDELIQNQRMKLARQNNNLKHDIKKTVSTSENKMIAQCSHNEYELQTLVHQVKDNNSKYYSLLQENLQVEKELRAQRLKVEIQLATWLDKYDQDIGEKQDEWDEIKAGYEREINEMSILQEEFEIQEDEYEKLMAEKEAEYRRELEQKMLIFIRNGAARRIQRYWKAYRERKLSKKKRHKGKKGKGGGSKGK